MCYFKCCTCSFCDSLPGRGGEGKQGFPSSLSCEWFDMDLKDGGQLGAGEAEVPTQKAQNPDAQVSVTCSPTG